MGEALSRLKKSAKQIKREIFVLIEAYKHPKVPFYIKVLATIIVAYAFSPVDLIPDFIPVIGYLDDLILIPLGISLVLKLIPKEILIECRESAKNTEKVKKKNWIAGIIITLIWAVILVWIYQLFF